jgi:CheY-like chemotaxis protein
MRVLVVDDDSVSRTVVVLLLSKHGFQVDEAKSGIQSLGMTRHAFYDFILMDIKMPEMNGFDAARAIINSKGPCAKSPIVALSGLVREDDRQKAFSSGMRGFLRKPFSVKETLKLFEAITLEQKMMPATLGYLADESPTLKKHSVSVIPGSVSSSSPKAFQ